MPVDPPIPRSRREIRAAGPRPQLDALRSSYLDLLKLALCDLVGSTTHMVWHGDGRLFSRELPDDDQRQWRVDGTDWPLNGLTMIGLRRLDDLQSCVEQIVAEGVKGDVIEAGVWRGGASILMRATLDSFGADDRQVWLADSFQGFPEPEPGDEHAQLDARMSSIGYLAPALDDVAGYFRRFGLERGVEFLPGFFQETMGRLRGRRWSVIRLDADSYDATRLALETLYPGLEVGGHLIIDDYYHFQIGVCRQAVEDFRAEHAITEPITRIDWTGARWRRESSAPIAPAATPAAAARPGSSRAAVREAEQRVPTDRELQLEDEVAALRAQLESLNDQAGRTRRARSAMLTRRTTKRGD